MLIHIFVLQIFTDPLLLKSLLLRPIASYE
uniref:Uncharacterized protein n=1 Tax=Anguilla anguilla TaxID=7936 RepID=A0A0E9X894_ANGAN